MTPAIGLVAPESDPTVKPADGRASNEKRRAFSDAFNAAYDRAARGAGDGNDGAQPASEAAGNASDMPADADNTAKAAEGRTSHQKKHALSRAFHEAYDRRTKDADGDVASAGEPTAADDGLAKDGDKDDDAAALQNAGGSVFGTQLAQLLMTGDAAKAKPGPSAQPSSPANAGSDGADEAVGSLVSALRLPGGPDMPTDAVAALGKTGELALPAGSAAGKSRVDVVHMATHFEPNPDQAVILENASSARRLSLKGGGDAAMTPLERAAAALQAAIDGGAEATSPAGSAKDAAAPTASAGEADDAGVSGDTDTAAPPRAASDRRHSTVIRNALQATAASDPKDKGDAARSKAAAAPADGPGGSVGGAGNSAASSGVAGQVASRIISALSPIVQGSSARPGHSAGGFKLTAGGAALKTMQIQLHPADLGTLDVSMRLVGGALAIELSASQSETVQLLSSDKDSLRKLLKDAGFSVDDASISIVARSAAVGRPQTIQAGNSSQANQGGMGQSGAGQSGMGQGGSDAGAGGNASAGSQSFGRQPGGFQQGTHDREGEALGRRGGEGASVYV